MARVVRHVQCGIILCPLKKMTQPRGSLLVSIFARRDKSSGNINSASLSGRVQRCQSRWRWRCWRSMVVGLEKSSDDFMQQGLPARPCGAALCLPADGSPCCYIDLVRLNKSSDNVSMPLPERQSTAVAPLSVTLLPSRSSDSRRTQMALLWTLRAATYSAVRPCDTSGWLTSIGDWWLEQMPPWQTHVHSMMLR